MRTLVPLIDCAYMLKKKVGCNALRAIAPEHVPSEENKNTMMQKKISLIPRKKLGEWLQTKSEMSTR